MWNFDDFRQRRDLVLMTYEITSWARLEDELAVDEELQQVQDVRINWGKILQEYLKYNSEL